VCFLDTAQQKRCIERTRRAWESATLSEQRSARQVTAPAVASGVCEREQLVTGRRLQRLVEAPRLGLRQNAIPKPASQIFGP
jgi:hypothetical protein